MTPAASWSVPQLRRACATWLFMVLMPNGESLRPCEISKMTKWQQRTGDVWWPNSLDKIYRFCHLRENFGETFATWQSSFIKLLFMMTLGCFHIPQPNTSWNQGTCSEPLVLQKANYSLTGLGLPIIWQHLIPSWPVNQQIPSVSILRLLP